MNNSVSDISQALSYPKSTEGYDEAYAAEPELRDHWRYLLDGLQSLGADSIHDRQLKAERILRDDGATYHSASIKSRAWQLDPVPILLESEEWGRIEAGLQERSELLNLLLKDLYGDREVIRHGVLPPELVYSHPGFLRACQGITTPGDHHLILTACDMVRDSDGSLCVISDRTQAPSGAGYALENRTVMSRVLPSLFRDSHVHRLALFFQSLRLKLQSLATQITSEQPRVVILTPGSYNETYFEHTYLANYLGYPLVQGSDLQVRDGYLWMKSLGGLERVDVVLRRVDDFFCDPVELKSGSHLGVPGLLEVIRAGRVIMANPLGSGVVENPALMRYLPQIGQHFLGREPRLPSVKSYWCGDPEDFDYVMSNIDSLVIKSCDERAQRGSIFVAELDKKAREDLLWRIKQRPLSFAAQEYIKPSMTPCWDGGQLCPRPTIMRSFAVASESSYAVLPGGLTRVGNTRQAKNLSNQAGAISKDTWILASEPEKQMTLRDTQPWQSSLQNQSRAAFPCRVVENLYWMGRYAERAESALRLLRTVFVELNSTYQMPLQAQRILLRAVTDITATYPGFVNASEAELKSPEEGLISVVVDPERSGSVTANLSALLTCTDQVREMLSADTQRVINDMRDELAVLPVTLNASGLNAAPEEALDPLVTSLLALSGLWQESMVRGLGWRFMDMGRRVEKALQSVRLLRSALVPVLPEHEQFGMLESVLLSSETLITFRRRYQSGSELVRGLELLLYDSTNPRSVFYQINLLKQHVSELPGATNGTSLSDEDRHLLEASAAIQLSKPEILAETVNDEGVRVELDKLMLRLQSLLQSTSAQISNKYFDHVKAHQQLVRNEWDEEL